MTIPDALLIRNCADRSLAPETVEEFVSLAGSPDALAITVLQDGRVVAVPRPASPAAAIEIVRKYAGHAVVRIGVTQLPAGPGIEESSRLEPSLVDPCENLRIGTAMFAKVIRVVARWYGNPTDDEAFPAIFNDAVYAWKVGRFEGIDIFRLAAVEGSATHPETREAQADDDDGREIAPSAFQSTGDDVGSAGMRIDLSRLGQR
jgi:hypothetical protein